MVDHEGIRPIKKICGDVIKFIDEFPILVEQLESLMQLLSGPSRQGIAVTEGVTGIFGILKGVVAVQAQMLPGRATPTDFTALNTRSPDVLGARYALGSLDKDDEVIGVTLEIGELEEQTVHDPQTIFLQGKTHIPVGPPFGHQIGIAQRHAAIPKQFEERGGSTKTPDIALQIQPG